MSKLDPGISSASIEPGTFLIIALKFRCFRKREEVVA
jgi:hypothetical protein